MTTTRTAKPYDRQPNETDKSWAAFCVYRDMGRDRSLEKVRLKLEHTANVIASRWSTKHNWVERCSAFDDDELQRESIALQELRLKRRLQMEKDAWNRRDKLIKKAETMMAIPIAKPSISEDGTQIFMPTDKWSLKDAIAFFQYADTLGIFATGGESKKFDEVEAVTVLASMGLLPSTAVVAISQGFDQFKNTIKEALLNEDGDNIARTGKIREPEDGSRCEAIALDSIVARASEVEPTIIPTAKRDLSILLSGQTGDRVQES